MGLFSTVTINEREFRELIEDIKINLNVLREKNEEGQAALREIAGYNEPANILARCHGAASARIWIAEEYVAKLERAAEVTKEERGLI